MFTLLVSSVRGQTGNWQRVENLPLGTRVSLLTRPPVRITCILVRVTDDQLACDPIHHSLIRLGPGVFTFDRRLVREVRLSNGATKVAVGAAVGGGFGAVLGAARDTCKGCRGIEIVLGALVFGVIGAGVGKIFPFFHGKLVYKRR